ncbi:MAG TPA: YciI family protein [Candidatus Limnocylindrales bacterium]|nr:YciI family protein [Candidatus Limnocylindrales bacterium]
MRFMMIVKANKDSEAGKMPSEALLAAMAKYNEELVNAGILVDLAGLQSSSKGFRVRFSGGKTSIIDGPFAETKELIAGYWVINVKSRQEAVDWARKIPATNDSNEEGEIEVRQFFELEDFAPGKAVDHHKEVGKKLAAGKK